VTSCDPLSIKLSDPTSVELRWSDGTVSRFSAQRLRGLCPCAGCVNESTGVRMHDPSSVAADLLQSGGRLVGRYGLALRFSDGHDTGIYSFQFLRQVGGEQGQGPLS
jgi:DUF971 family protein